MKRRMRGVAFIGGEGPNGADCQAIAAGADLCLAADSGLALAENAGLRPDWVVGDMDSLDDPGRLDKYPADRVRRYPVDKDDTDTEIALATLWDSGCEEVWLAGGGGGRLDHVFALRALFERPRVPFRWYTGSQTLFVLEAGGERACLALDGGAGCVVSVFPAGGGPWAAESSGLKWSLDGLAWNGGFFGLSNTAPDGSFSVTAFQGRFLVVTGGTALNVKDRFS